MLKRGRKTDETRNLCQTCVNINTDCSNENTETGELDNIFKCDGYKKANINKLRWRANIGEEYYVIILNANGKSDKDFKPHKRVEKDSVHDSLYHEIGNYFKTIGETEKEIVRWSSL
jgi:hypothetical protein